MQIYILKKVSQYLHSKTWDTRVASAHAIGAIAENAKHTSLNELIATIATKLSKAGISGSVEDVCAWPYLQSRITGSAFRRLDNVHYLSIIPPLEIEALFLEDIYFFYSLIALTSTRFLNLVCY
ncbi:hypothetical protein QN277_018704 [Acacia crassicarpa]|uniref:Uncharacterized protein n=1 Tax=Acacia crassicarpa TaxID=499986 RepID=A0AAE1MRU7_9FABA|nr:hypothetical protein QN277_018704 [Acacia crassicarpa]